MNRDTVFKLVTLMAVVSIVAACILGLLRPEGFLTFTGFIASMFVTITGFAVLLFNLVKVKETAQEAVKNTNGRLEQERRENRELRAILIETGNADKLLTLENNS